MRFDEDKPILEVVQQLKEEIEAFAALNRVRANLEAWSPFGAISGVQLTDLFAEEPGNGAGSRVMRKLHELADEVRLPIYLRPAGPDSRRFYERHGYVQARGAFAHLVRFPTLTEDDLEMMRPRQVA